MFKQLRHTDAQLAHRPEAIQAAPTGPPPMLSRPAELRGFNLQHRRHPGGHRLQIDTPGPQKALALQLLACGRQNRFNEPTVTPDALTGFK